MEAEKLKDIVLNAKQPYVITKRKLPWNCFELTFEEWCHLFDSCSKDLTPFAGSTVSSGCSPQWERQRTEMRMRMTDICKSSSSIPGRWNSFSYRNIHELPEDEIRSESSIDESYEILNYLLNLKQTNKQHCSGLKRYPFGFISGNEFDKLVDACESEVKAVPRLDPCEFFHLMKKNSSRYDPALDLQYAGSQRERLDRIRKVININCAPDTVGLIEKLL
ncbi:AGAP004022-PA-like protein [Anopheles sinensis]|uniref:AGAP004022-PA-like protein n=1 Tax=Anopheles sinensis TaxID=74873 RepID=A0A084VTL8_ANOSI|nr:AGAP004022-PA-like protein [Anopheles sinensis]